MLRALGRWFGPPQLNVEEPVASLDGWALADELPQSEPVASWLGELAGELPDAVVPEVVVSLDSHDLLETVPEEVADDGLAVPVLTSGTGRAWLGIVAGGVAIVCAVIGIFAAG